MPTAPKTQSFQIEEILSAEYKYIAETAAQANEDRARVSSFYLVSVGSLVAALFSARFFGPDSDSGELSLLFSGLFLVLTLLGTTTIVQLARLRAAWFESALAMNQIKEYAISKDRGLEKAFLWRKPSLPSRFKINSVSFMQTVEVALLSGLMFGAAVYFLQAELTNSQPVWIWITAIGAGLLVSLFQALLYKRLLR